MVRGRFSGQAHDNQYEALFLGLWGGGSMVRPSDEMELNSRAACEHMIRIARENVRHDEDAESKIKHLQDAMAEVHRRSLALFWSSLTLNSWRQEDSSP